MSSNNTKLTHCTENKKNQGQNVKYLFGSCFDWLYFLCAHDLEVEKEIMNLNPVSGLFNVA